MESPLDEFPEQVIASHAWLVAEILSGQQPSAQIFIQLGAEILSIDKLAALECRRVGTIKQARACWTTASQCFQASAELWAQISSNGEFTEAHRHLLHRLCCSADDRVEFYSVTTERTAYRRRKVEPLPVAEGSNGAAP
jgi:hypothetical protein